MALLVRARWKISDLMREFYENVVVDLGADAMPMTHALATWTEVIQEQCWVSFVERDNTWYALY